MPNDTSWTRRYRDGQLISETSREFTDEEQADVTDCQLLVAYKRIQDPTAAQTIRAFQVFLRRFA